MIFFLCFTLEKAKKNIEEALRDDFDFVRVTTEIELLVHRGNLELHRKPLNQV